MLSFRAVYLFQELPATYLSDCGQRCAKAIPLPHKAVEHRPAVTLQYSLSPK